MLCMLNGLIQTTGATELNKIGAAVREPVFKIASLNDLIDNVTEVNASDLDTDWIPGDWGYIKNNFEKPDKFLEGENILYPGGTFATGAEFKKQKSFWGLTSAGGFQDSLEEWQKKVTSWNGVESTITNRRTMIKGSLLGK